jgi:hypothetical protein
VPEHLCSLDVLAHELLHRPRVDASGQACMYAPSNSGAEGEGSAPAADVPTLLQQHSGNAWVTNVTLQGDSETPCAAVRVAEGASMLFAGTFAHDVPCSCPSCEAGLMHCMHVRQAERGNAVMHACELPPASWYTCSQ